ncbi:MAG TPA: dihydroorotase [Clostridiales bacterium]|nr:dihydroorotase [Clostridiales bacterium]
MKDILIKNCDIVHADGVQAGMDILVHGGVVEKTGKRITGGASRVIDGEGLYAFPGFCDLHSHLRDPGLTHKEDIVTGTKSAAAGGFTTVCCMPNTNPPVDSVETVRYILDKADAAGFARVLPVAAITKGLKGGVLTDFAALARAGAIAFSDDGMPVQDDDVILAAMRLAKKENALLMLHEEDLKNRGSGVANAGQYAEQAGLSGIPNAIEDSMTARDLYYAQKTGARIHLCHVSTEGSVELVRRAKKNGVHVTCETMPHYFSLTDECVVGGDPNTKVNPPLRSARDRDAVIAGIVDGTIDAIATDHAPHSESEKNTSFADAPFGLIGFETAFSLLVTNLYRTGRIELRDIARLLAAAPCSILGIAGGRIGENERADITLCDMEKKYTYQKNDVVSKAKNSPFFGSELLGAVMVTIAGGKVTYDR